MGPEIVGPIVGALLAIAASVTGIAAHFHHKRRAAEPEGIVIEPPRAVDVEATGRFRLVPEASEDAANAARNLAALGKTVASIDELLWQMDARLRRLPTREDLRDEVRDLRAAQRRISEEQAAIRRVLEAGKE